MINLFAQSSAHLLQLLGAIDISVPPRGEGRTSDHCERWSICRFLATYADSELLEFPLRLEKRERPDFLVSLPHEDVGIEVTEAVPADWARVAAHSQKQDGDDVAFLHRFRPGENLRSVDEVKRIATGASWGAAWAGDSPERDWAEAMVHFVMQKVKTFAKPGFGRFASNWLLIYDNWPLPDVDRASAAGYFMRRLLDLNQSLPFERIFVESGQSIWQLCAGELSSCPVRDLWAPADEAS